MERRAAGWCHRPMTRCPFLRDRPGLLKGLGELVGMSLGREHKELIPEDGLLTEIFDSAVLFNIYSGCASFFMNSDCFVREFLVHLHA